MMNTFVILATELSNINFMVNLKKFSLKHLTIFLDAAILLLALLWRHINSIRKDWRN